MKGKLFFFGTLLGVFVCRGDIIMAFLPLGFAYSGILNICMVKMISMKVFYDKKLKKHDFPV